MTNRFPKIAYLLNPKNRLRLVLTGAAIVMFMLFFVALGLPLTSNSRLCGDMCHATSRQYFSWKKSSHSNVPCASCHSKLGPITLFTEKLIESPRYIYAELTSYKQPLNSDGNVGLNKITREICERCHSLKRRKVTPSLRFKSKMIGSGSSKYHAKHIKKGIQCTVCHNRVAHKKVNDPMILRQANYSPTSKAAKYNYLDGLSMVQGCYRCHSPFKKERNEELIAKYEAQNAPKKCTNCHDKDMLPMGHGEGWTKTHPVAAKKTGFEFCWKCHDKGKRFQSADGKRSRCRDCHHRIMAKTVLTLKNCVVCHKDMGINSTTLVTRGQSAVRLEKNHKKAQYLRRMVYHKVHFSKKFKCTKCHLADLETTKKATLELCKNKGCHPPGQKTPASGAKLCIQCHKQPHQFLGK